MNTSAGTDNRRVALRIVSYDILRTLSSLSRIHGGDVIETIAFTGVWTLNTRHLIDQPTRYAELRDVPPDAQRRPASMQELQQLTAIPPAILEDYVQRLLDNGMVERLPGGLVVPSAVFTRPEMLDGSNEVQQRVVAMINRLREAGVHVG